MKLLVHHDLGALNAFLTAVNVGDYVVSGQVESYSCASRPIDALRKQFVKRGDAGESRVSRARVARRGNRRARETRDEEGLTNDALRAR